MKLKDPRAGPPPTGGKKREFEKNPGWTSSQTFRTQLLPKRYRDLRQKGNPRLTLNTHNRKCKNREPMEIWKPQELTLVENAFKKSLSQVA